jgi:hypothetical protein
MKKLLLLIVGIVLALSLQAQQRPAKTLIPLPASIANKSVKVQRDFTAIENWQPKSVLKTSSPYLQRTSSAVSETIIGATEYDLQSNRSTAKRISNNGDGTISAVWTGSADRNGYPDRGTWYNYFNGSSWGSAAGPVEPIRCGFTNIDVANGNEYVMVHNGNSVGVLSYRNKGTGSWQSIIGVGGALPSGYTDVWFRFAVGGTNNQTIHAIVNSQGTQNTPVAGQSGPITYNRSQDGGQTWDIQHTVIPAIDSSNYYGFSAEDYHIDARGNTVAIVAGGFANDAVLLKSTDNGTTWTKTIILAFPDPIYLNGDHVVGIIDVNLDGVADTVETNAGDITVTIDNNNICHVAFGRMRALDDDTTAEESYFPGTDGLYYWNETMAQPVIIAGVEDLNGDGVISFPQNPNYSFGLYNTGLTQQPSIGIDAQNNIYIAYSSINELTDTTFFQQALRHVWAIKSTDGGTSWSVPLDVVPMSAQGGDGEFQEAVYPSLATLVDNQLHIVYQRDVAPGHSLSSDATQAANNTATNDIVYVSVPVTDLVSGINTASSPTQSFSVSQNYPNPFKGSSSFEIELDKSATTTLEIHNIYGQLIQQEQLGKLQPGKHIINIDGRNLSAGMYYYTINVNGEKVSKNFIIR